VVKENVGAAMTLLWSPREADELEAMACAAQLSTLVYNHATELFLDLVDGETVSFCRQP
jgi:hypothetical protein